MQKKINKREEMLKLSDEILSDIELGKLSLEKIISKCKKLARMRNDFEALKWFRLELHGYDRTTLPADITEDNLNEFSYLAGRTTKSLDPVTQKEEWRYWTPSIPELESIIATNETKLASLKTPAHFTPAISKSPSSGFMSGATWVQESFRDVLKAIQAQQNTISNEINQKKSLLSKIVNNIYNYILNINLQLKFESISESVFQDTKEAVDKYLQILCPNAIKQFLAVYDRLESSNDEAWSQAMSSCRNILKEFADKVFPAQTENYIRSNDEAIAVTEDKYKNRIIAFIDKTTKGRREKQLISTRASDLMDTTHALNNFLSDGAKNKITKQDANICVLETYLLLASLIELHKSEKSANTA